jgi:hypothetical protein
VGGCRFPAEIPGIATYAVTENRPHPRSQRGDGGNREGWPGEVNESQDQDRQASGLAGSGISAAADGDPVSGVGSRAPARAAGSLTVGPGSRRLPDRSRPHRLLHNGSLL